MDPIEERHPHGGGWLRETVFGLNDGLVTTLAFVLAVNGVAHQAVVLVALGEMFAGGISMALGGYLSARTERAVLRHQIATERYEIAHEPEEEKAELRRIYQDKGLRGRLLDQVIRHLTSDADRWLTTMVREELGVVDAESELQPWVRGVLVGMSFIIGALVPIIPFLFAWSAPQVWAYGLTVVTAFLLGRAKARYTLHGAVYNGMEFLAVVTVGAVAGLLIGLVLRAIAGSQG